MCLPVSAVLQPGETMTTYWGQHGLSGQLVSPGTYFLNGQPFQIGATNFGIAPLGSPHPGSSRPLQLCAPNQPNAAYVMAASFSSTNGIALGCGRVLPLDEDLLLAASISGSHTFPGFIGTLDNLGQTVAPQIVLPPLPSLVGIRFQLAAVTIDPTAPCGIGDISAAVSVVIE